MNGNYPPGMTPADWNHVNGVNFHDDDDREEFDPSCDDGGYCRGDEDRQERR